jgi:hypothetical protein
MAKSWRLGVGMRAAKYPNIVVTDADCLPTGRDWVSIMAAGFKGKGKQIVIGHSPYAEQARPRFLQLVGALRRVHEGHCSTWALRMAGFPYMGVGRNMGIHAREIFFSAKGSRQATTTS